MSQTAPPVVIGEAERAFATETKQTTRIAPDAVDTDGESPVLLPTDKTVHRKYVGGEPANSTPLALAGDVWLGRLHGPTGSMHVHVGRFESMGIRQEGSSDSPAYVAVPGSPRPTRTASGSAYVFMYPDTVHRVDQSAMTEWIVETCDRTLERIELLEDEATAEAALAREEYDIEVDRYRDVLTDVLENTVA